ncbi:MAG: tail fiber protein [Pseudomonadota bacterium]|nr:tail fiber protein [Pseudomonadota bacterium]
MEPFIGQLMLVGFNFAPKGWAFCNGQLMSIAQNTALFSLLGTTYGGDGITTFALPDLRGRAPIHFGQGPGLSNYVQGEVTGTESVSLLTTNLPAHTHAIVANNGTGNTNSPEGAFLAGYGSSAPPEGPYTNASPNTTLSPGSVAPTGGSQPVGILNPLLVLNWVIALEGIFPSRS